MTPEANKQVVLVTGGSGYVGGWMVVALLQRGYQVRTTLRSLSRESAVRADISRQVDPGDRLRFFAADLLRDEGWDEAVAGCDFVLHVASPMGQGAPEGTNLLRPAREGTLRILRAASRAGVQRTVITSSVVAAQPVRTVGAVAPSDESVWTHVEGKDDSDYARSKTLAERAAWDFLNTARGGMTLTTILPGMILGPVMTQSVAGSVEIVSRLLQGRVPAVPRVGFGIVDVRDLTELHLRAMVTPAAAGQRYIAISEFLWLADIADILRKQFGPRAAKVPTRRLPDLVLRLASLFQAEARFMAPMLGKRSEYSAAKAAAQLDWHARPAAKTVQDCADSLFQHALV